MPTTSPHRSKTAFQPRCYSSNRSSVIVCGHSPVYLKPETLPRYNSDLSSKPVWFRDTVISFFASIQSVASVLHADSEFSQTRVFRFTAPIAVFLSVLSTIAILPQTWVILDDHLAETNFLCMIMVATFVVLGTLASLWLLIWVSALLIKRFMEKDFSALLGCSIMSWADGSLINRCMITELHEWAEYGEKYIR